MNYVEAYRALKRKFPNREANTCNYVNNQKYVFCFLPTPNEVDEDGIVLDLPVYSVDKNTGKIERVFFQELVGKLDSAIRYEFDEKDIL